jgi:mono/diheme cytochrome c family protein
MEGPDLSHVGIKGYNPDWYAAHLQKSQQATEGAWKTSFNEVNETDRAALKIFLDTQMGAPKLIEAKAQFNTVGCAGCHTVGSFGGDAGVNLSLSGLKDPNQLNFSRVHGDHTVSNWIVQHFRSPASTVAGSQMPSLGLTENQIDLLTLYTLSLRRRTLPDTYLPKDRVKAMRFGIREFANDGETIFTAVCSSCHGADGRGRRFAGLPNIRRSQTPIFWGLHPMIF